jgi:hypothetical protein
MEVATVNEINREIYLVQNPAIGAAILWQFVCGYYYGTEENKQVPFPLLFIVLPIIFREDLRSVIDGTNKPSGLQKVSEKLFKDKRTDLVCSIHDSAEQYRAITLTAISIATRKGLISVDANTATLLPLLKKGSKMPKSSEKLLKLGEKLGLWCSAMSLHEISQLLKVRF